MGHTEKGLYKGSKLNDNRWHTLHFQRRGKTVELALDNELPEIGKYHLLYQTQWILSDLILLGWLTLMLKFLQWNYISAEIFGSDTFLHHGKVFVGMVPPKSETIPLLSKPQNFKGSIQQLKLNGIPYLENMRKGLLIENIDYKTTAAWTPTDDAVYHAITFKNHKTYMGLPQMKIYSDISVYFQIKTLEPNGMLNIMITFLYMSIILKLMFW